MTRVAIIDDHVVVRAGLRYIIEADPELEFVAEFGGGLGAADFVMFNAPDVVLLDVRMPDRNGIDALRDILKVNPAARVIMLTTSDAEEDVFRAIEEGALGYVMKDSEIEVISAAIRSAMAGEVYMADDVRKIYETRKGSKGLSTREAQVLKLAATGGNNKEIAKEMGLSENSVKMFLKRAFYKLGASNRAEAVQLAVKRGLIEAGFTLIELLVVTVVVAILASIIFKLAGSVEGKTELQTTIIRMQKLENCLSGYYAAFGCYPPVPLQGRSRNPFYPIKKIQGKIGPLIQDTSAAPNYGTYEYNSKEGNGSIEAACRAQPLAAVFPYSLDFVDKYDREGHTTPSDAWNAAIRNYIDQDPNFAKSYKDYTAIIPFAGDQGSGNDGNADKWRWMEQQKFCFGLMSFLLPRYLLMMGCSNDDLYELFQWDGNNSLPCRFDSGVPYTSWSELNEELKVDSESEKGEQNRRLVELIPSQAVTQRWLPNLERICSAPAVEGLTGTRLFVFYGIDVGGDKLPMDPKHAEHPSKYTFLGSGTGKSPNVLTVVDGWGEEFFYYSPPPYQNYRLWSSGGNKVTFPPWFSEEEMKEHFNRDITYVTSSFETKLISVKEALADDVVHLSH